MLITSRFEATKAGRRPLLYRSKETGAIYIGASFDMEDYQVEPVYGKLTIEVTP